MPPTAVALDLDGVIWRGAEPIAGAAEAVGRLRAAGVPLAFVTNNAGPTVAEQEAKLAHFDIDATGAVVSSPQAAAGLLAAGERVLVAGGPGVVEAVRAAGATPLTYAEADGQAVDAVVVGIHRDFDYDRMRIASTAIRDGARFIATNDDATFPAAGGEVPGNGAIVAAIATAAGRAPTIAGKPHPPIVDLLLRRLGAEGIVVGDRPDTDGRYARALGWRFGLVLSGVTAATDLPVTPVPDLVAVDLAALVDQLLDGH